MRNLLVSKKAKFALIVILMSVFITMLPLQVAIGSPASTISEGGSAATAEASPAATSVSNAETTCLNWSPLSWILCPIIFIGTEIADASYSFILESFLSINLHNFGEATRKVWESFRDIANVGFIIAFLVMIFSHLTGFGITAYHIKKMIPKIIISVILINLSFFITQILVEISNIAGSSVQGFFGSLIPAASTTKESISLGGFGLSGLITTLIITVVAKNTTGAFFLQFIIPVLLFIIVTLFVTIFILVARQAIVIFLTILSPLAFLSIITPNTESLFKSWKKILTGVLITYPMIGLIFGASNLAGEILANAAGTDWLLGIMAKIIMVVPLIAAPSAIKNSIAAVPMIGGKLAGMASGLQKGAWKKSRGSDLSKAYQDRHKSLMNRRKIQRFSDTRADGSQKTGLGRTMAGIRRSAMPGQEARYNSEISKQVSGMAGGMTEQDAQFLLKNGGKELTKEQLGGMSSDFRAAYYASGGNMAMANMASAEHLAQKGRLRADQYQTFAQNASKQKGYSNQMAYDSSNRILANAGSKGAVDTAAYIDDIMTNSGGNIGAGTTNSLTSDVVENYVKGMSSDQLAGISAGALAKGSTTESAFKSMSTDIAFQQRVQTAANSGNMSTETHEALSRVTGGAI